MKIGVPTESLPGERRVALVPDGVGRLRKAGYEVLVQRGAGAGAHIPDEGYAEAGATLVPEAAGVLREAEVVLKVQRPTAAEVSALRRGAHLISFLQPAQSGDLLATLAERGVTAFAMELVPRTTKAQSMDALSSQATIAGYKAVLLGAETLGKVFPMLTTAAGTLVPAKVFIIGAGVAGLQAIATARRLGAVVSAFDVRAAVREQVQSLGANFVAMPVTPEAEGAGGYAKELDAAQQQRVLETIAGHIADMDVVITTAQIPGKPAPRLITEAMVARMRPGSVIVDLAVETGGNCVHTRPGETVEVDGVAVLGPDNLVATVPLHASQMYSKNLTTLIDHMTQDGAFRADLEDAIVGPMCVVHAGAIRFGRAA